MQRWWSALLWAGGILVVLLVCCGGPATVIQAVRNEFAENLRPPDTDSESAADARRRGVLVSEWSVVPPEVEVPGGWLQFGEAWVEERSRSTHRLVWFPAEERLGGYRLYVKYTLRVNQDASGTTRGSAMLVPDDKGVGHVIGSAADGPRVYTHLIDDPDVAGLRLSVVESFDAPRAKNIRLVPKAK
jgi:hypothetical protein